MRGAPAPLTLRPFRAPESVGHTEPGLALVCAFVCAFVSAFVCSFRGLFACVLSWVEIYYIVRECVALS